jgi:PAS domain S-box/diguanylate cyclase (GGDEF) domain
MDMMTEILKSVIENTADGIYFVDRARRITVWNSAAERITGYSRTEMIGKHCQDNLLNHVDKEGRLLCQTSCPLYATMVDGVSRTAEVLLRHKDGHRVPITVKTIPAYKDAEIIGAIEVFTLKATVQYDDNFVEALTDIATIDQLTGLYSRNYLESVLAYKFSEAAWLGKNICVALIDVDNMHEFNKRYQKQTGDVLLQRIAASLSCNIDKRDVLGRWEDDKFVVVFDLAPGINLKSVADRLRVLVAQSGVMHGGQYLSLTASVGMSTVRRGETAGSIMARVLALVQQCKRSGKNRSEIYIPQNTEQLPLVTPGMTNI